MKKTALKYLILLSLAIGVFVFILSLIANFLIATFLPNLFTKISILLIFGILSGSVITTAIVLFNPLFSDWIIMLRRLLRFDSLSHPLIERLSHEAPGTYHHSINVSVMGQQAAKVISADALLVRIAAYYHDIGKLDHPLRFIENQAGYEIPHTEDEAKIKESAEQIINHTKRGMEIASSYHLPEEIINLISEHHGTTKVLYFYELAREKKLKIKLTDFKYPGPVPQSKESAILMLADSIEAATRATPELNNEKIKTIVGDVITSRARENQFKRCNFAPGELAKIGESFTASVKSIYHQRISYKKDE